ncbi:MAG: hypothetical protein AB8G77_15120 [Rhodothermales bacterium]
MRLSLIILLVVLSGCEQEMPHPAMALTDTEKAMIAETVKEHSESLRLFFEDSDFARVDSMLVSDGYSQLINGQAIWTSEEALGMFKSGSEYSTSNNMRGEVEHVRQDMTVLSETDVLEIVAFTQKTYQADSLIADAEGTRTILWKKGEPDWQIKHVHVSYKNPQNEEG